MKVRNKLMDNITNIKDIKRKLKLKDLRPLLVNDRINLYLEPNNPIKYELWGFDDKTGNLSEYRPLEDYNESRPNDTMFLDYGDYTIEEIGIEKLDKEEPSLNKEGVLSIYITK